MIDKIIVCRLRIGWCGEVYSVGFARLFDGSVIARKADHAGVEICETHSARTIEILPAVSRTGNILPDLLDRIPRRIHTNENRHNLLLPQQIHRTPHLIELLGTYIGAMGESEIHERPSAEEIFVGEGLVLGGC